MNKTNKFIWFISIIALCFLGFVLYGIISKKSDDTNVKKNIIENGEYLTDTEFSDGLTNPVSSTNYPLDEDEVGISEKSIYLVDINNDNVSDRITKSFFENGNAHSYYEYKVELNKNGKYVDITPQNLRSVNGADCDLQQVKFVFKPRFKIIMIYREMGETLVEPTMAKRRVFVLSDENLNASEDKNLRIVCDVKELF